MSIRKRIQLRRQNKAWLEKIYVNIADVKVAQDHLRLCGLALRDRLDRLQREQAEYEMALVLPPKNFTGTIFDRTIEL